MLRMIKLLLPALIPSWRFFKSVEPSPRIEYRFGATGSDAEWSDAFPLPDQVPVAAMLSRLFWNPRWNKYLYVVTCAERLAETGDPFRVAQINAHLTELHPPPASAGTLEFRLSFVSAQEGTLVREVVFQSDPVAVCR